VPRVDALQSPVAVTVDSHDRVFVADPGAKAVHVFDFIRSKYGLLDGAATVCAIRSRSLWTVKTIYMSSTGAAEQCSSTTRLGNFAAIWGNSEGRIVLR